MKPVLIRWVDSGRWDGWESPEDALKSAHETSMVCESLAWLVGESSEWVLISSSRSGEKEVLSTLQIPRVSIEYIKELDLSGSEEEASGLCRGAEENTGRGLFG